MPVTHSATKSLRRDKRRAKVNLKIRAKMKAAVKEARLKKTAEALKKAYSALDRAAKKKVIHKTKASRLKSRLAAWIKKDNTVKPTKKAKAVKAKTAKKKTAKK